MDDHDAVELFFADSLDIGENFLNLYLNIDQNVYIYSKSKNVKLIVKFTQIKSFEQRGISDLTMLVKDSQIPVLQWYARRPKIGILIVELIVVFDNSIMGKILKFTLSNIEKDLELYVKINDRSLPEIYS